MKQRGKHHNKLTDTERKLISIWKNEGLSNKDIAKRLARHISTIGRELTRNSCTHVVHIVYGTGKSATDRVSAPHTNRAYEARCTPFYNPTIAQRKADKRKKNAWNAKQPLKSPCIYRYTVQRLIRGWSPEQIAGRAYYETGKHTICAETIYKFIYHKRNKNWKLWEYLRRGQKRRRKRNGRKVRRSHIPDRISIHDRPEEINTRQVFGHWEGDSVVGFGHASGVHTTYERVSSMYLIEPMEDMTSTSSIQAQLKLYRILPPKARKSTTLDNGSEHVKHIRLKKVLNMDTYFADPYSSWQRGGNENGNLWLRYYFPKGTDFNKVAYEDIKAVQWELNNRPRKRLGFKTPQEVFDEELEKLRGCDR